MSSALNSISLMESSYQRRHSSRSASRRPGMTVPLCTDVFDARVEHRIEHVDEEIDEHHGSSDEHDEVLHDRVIPLRQRGDEIARQARHVEYRFGDDQAAHEKYRLDP